MKSTPIMLLILKYSILVTHNNDSHSERFVEVDLVNNLKGLLISKISCQEQIDTKLVNNICNVD